MGRMKALSICLLIWLSVVAAALLCGYTQSTRVNASLKWPTTDGRVEVAQVDQMGGRYWPKLTYSYLVNNVPHTGGSISNKDLILDVPNLGSRDQGWALGRLARFSPGQHVTVHYEPAKPYRSWLVAESADYWQCVPMWGFLLQLVAATAVMQRLFVTRKAWLILPGLLSLFVLWVCFFIAMRPQG